MQQFAGLTKIDENLIKDVGGLAISLGICKAIYEENQRIINHMPVSYFPYSMSVDTYDRLKGIHCIWQKLFVKLAEDRKFVIDLAEKFCQDDQFMIRFLSMYKQENKQQVRIACTRVDYMGDENPQLVEYNLMSVGLNGMSDRVQQLHRILHECKSEDQNVKNVKFPISQNQKTLCSALITALKEAKLNKGIILMVVHDKQFNYGDHHAFKLEMIKNGRPVHTVTMLFLIENMKYDDETGIATLNGQEIDAFYFRTCYALNQFPNEDHWILRQKIEKSRALKFPSMDMILINSKRMQSQIAKPSVLSRYLNEQQANLILNVSGQIHDFDNKTNEQIEELIRKTQSESYVLKPNREGGGNNFFDAKATQKLKQLHKDSTNLKNYILMKRIESTAWPNYFIFNNVPNYMPSVTTEFSTLGCFVYKNSHMILNEFGGTLARLKSSDVDEGGIAINQGVLSGVCFNLIDIA